MMELWSKLFKNANHAIWFWCSIGMLMLVIAHVYFPRQRIAWIIIPLIAHLPQLVTAGYCSMRKKASEIYSRDCIWFKLYTV